MLGEESPSKAVLEHEQMLAPPVEDVGNSDKNLCEEQKNQIELLKQALSEVLQVNDNVLTSLID